MICDSFPVDFEKVDENIINVILKKISSIMECVKRDARIKQNNNLLGKVSIIIFKHLKFINSSKAFDTVYSLRF